MPRRIDADVERARAALAPVVTNPLAIVADDDIETPALPHDLPAWARDAVAISQRARTLLARVKPAVVRVLTFWDHSVRAAFISGKRLTIDISGSYRLR